MNLDSTSPFEAARLETLCRAAAGGDAPATESLLAGYHGLLMAFARRKVGVDWRGRIEAEEVLQEAYVDAFASIRNFEYRGEDSFYRWMTQIIDRRFVDQLRRWTRKKRDPAREALAANRSSQSYFNLLEQCRADTSTPSMIANLADATGLLMCCMAQLPEHYRDVVQRLYLDQQDFGTVAAEMGRSEDAVRRMVGRALESLRECLGRASRYLSSHH